jgi:oligopeptide transport system substrate-binding protein
MASGKTWNRRIALAGGAALAATGGYFALRGPSGSRAPRKVTDARTLLRGNAAEPETLDPTQSSGTQESEIMGDLMIGLTTHDPACKAIPGMATHWETSGDGLIWTFHLREALWSDGVPVTAGDFVFSWQRLVDPASASSYAYFLHLIKNGVAISAGKMPPSALGARAIDARTLRVELEHPAPYLLELFTHGTTYPLPRHVVTAKGKAWARPGNYVSNGPFTLKQWIPNDYVLLEKNPRFYDAANVALEQVYFYPTSDYGAALRRFQVGELDFQDRYPTQKVDWIRKNLPQTIDPVPSLITEIVGVNHKREPFSDVRVREAINLALNREVITQRILRNGEVPAYNVVPPGIANYQGGLAYDFKALNYAQRIEKAQSLMRAAGFGESKRLRTTYMIRSTAPTVGRAIAAAIQQMLAQVYIDITITPNDMQVFYPAIQEHNFDIAQAGWAADFSDASNFLDLFRTGGGNNWGEYSNPAFDAALDGAQREADVNRRSEKLAQAESIFLKDHAAMPLWFWVSLNLTWPYVKGLEANALDYHRSRWISIDQAARIQQFA